MMKKKYFIPQVDILPYRTDDLCAGGGDSDMNPVSSHIPDEEGGRTAPGRLYI